MNKKIVLVVFISMCFLSAISFTQFIVSVKANPYTDVSVSEAKAMIDSNPDLVILDVRTQSEYDSGHIGNAILIPYDELPYRLDELDKEKDTLVYCKAGGRSVIACGTLDGAGFTSVYNMLGGILAWIDAGYPIEPPPPSVPEFPIGLAMEIFSIPVIIYMLWKNKRKQNIHK